MLQRITWNLRQRKGGLGMAIRSLHCPLRYLCEEAGMAALSPSSACEFQSQGVAARQGARIAHPGACVRPVRAS